jgi:hypothetical protein
MNTPAAVALIADVEVVKVEVTLSLSGIEKNTPLIECLWPRVTFSCWGKQKVHPFTYWREMMETKKDDPNFKYHTMDDLVFLTAGLRPVKRPYVLADAAEAKAKMCYKKIQQKLAQASQKKSFQERHRKLMRKIERAAGKKAIRDLLLSLPHRLEKRDVVEAWHEAVVHKVMES